MILTSVTITYNLFLNTVRLYVLWYISFIKSDFHQSPVAPGDNFLLQREGVMGRGGRGRTVAVVQVTGLKVSGDRGARR